MRTIRVLRMTAIAVFCVLFGTGIAFGQSVQPVQLSAGGFQINPGESAWFANTHVPESMTFSLKNTGSSDLSFGSDAITIAGLNAGSFSVVSQPPATLAPGATGTFVVRFSPSYKGVNRALMTVAALDQNNAATSYAIDLKAFYARS